jgi:serine/threonine protein kinase/Tfp pilus assembly protein PilF
MIGETISHYRILEKIGAGSMGEVYKAEDTRLNRFVALKLLKSLPPDASHRTVIDNPSAQSDTARLRFLREAQAASAINHPNIATVYEIDEVEQNGARYSFIAMEYVPGQTLKEVRGQLGLDELLDIFQQMADGLAEAHERGIVHRDIKPSNILITENNRVKVLDFGVAKYNPLAQTDVANEETASLFHTNLLLTSPGTLLGTFAYMSPEQALGEEVDGRSDIFSLGIVFYEMLAERPPFAGSSALAVVDAILHATPAPLSLYHRNLPPKLEDIVHRMIAKDRALRYQSLRDVVLDLSTVQGGLTEVLSGNGNSGGNLLAPADDKYATQISSSDMLGQALAAARTGKGIAVLRFNNITGSKEDEWIGELIYEVLRLWNVDNQPDFDEKFATRVGREVGARWIIGGGYQRLGDMLRITARLVEVETGEVIKTVKIDGRMQEIFELQDRIVYELSRDLELNLVISDRSVIEARETNVLEAYETYIRGRELAYTGTVEGIEGAIALAEKAIQLDPSYAQAYAGLAYSLVLKGQAVAQPELIEQAIAHAEKAIELQPNLPDSYSILGFAFIALDRADDAIGALRRALAFAPNDSFVRSSLGRAYFIGKGMFREAAAEFERALQDPAENAWIAPSLAHVYCYLGNYARAEELARLAVEAQKQYYYNHEGVQIIGAYARLGTVFALQDRINEAIAEYQRELDFCERSTHALKERVLIEVRQKLASAYVRQGKLDEARAAFEAMMAGFRVRVAGGADDPFTRFYIACGCAVMGEQEQALEHLAKAIEGRRCFNIARAQIERDLEGLRDNPRFQALLTNPTAC